MKRSDAIKRKFEKIISRKNVSVAEIDREMFGSVEEEKWPEILSLLKNKAKEELKTRESKRSLLTLYWLRYEEQLSTKHIPRHGLFLKDEEIPQLIFEEGNKVLMSIKKGDYSKENFEYLRYIIEALGNLEIDLDKSLSMLTEIQDYLATVDVEKDTIQKLKAKIVYALDNRKKVSSKFHE